jgi:hypothetical protein
VELNHPFFGVAFEAQTEAAQTESFQSQIASARLLVEMLRSKYAIAADNCVTHAQVSVNPGNMQIGYHTDWAANFPFEELGLPNGYRAANPAVLRFGFNYAQGFIDALDGNLWPGLVSAEQQIVRDSAAAGITPAHYRKRLQEKYHQTLIAARRQTDAAERNQYENREQRNRPRHRNQPHRGGPAPQRPGPA